MSKTKRGVCANCHTVFEVSKKQRYKIKNGKSVFCSQTCSLEKYGKTKITIKDKSVAERLRIEAEKKYFGKYDRKYLK